MFLLAAAFAVLPQRFVSNEALQPRTYVSASGEWSLFVDPSARDGAGKSTIRISKQGTLQWTGEKPFTFREAVVDDSGVSGGFGYSHGEEGRSESEGTLVVALLGPDGTTLLVDETPRESRNAMHMPPRPCAKQILLHPGLRSVVVRLDQPGAVDFSECWFVYTLSPAKKLEPVRGERELQAAEQQVWTFALAAIRGTPLTLAHWHTPGELGVPGSGSGSEFALYDESWKLVWSLPLTGDLEVDDDHLRDDLFEQMRNGGGILDTKTERHFELRHVAKSERVIYEVTRDSEEKTGWPVRELSRTPFKAEPPKQKKEGEPAKLQLPAAGTVALDVGPRETSGPVRKILAFTVGTDDQITFVRDEQHENAASLVTIDGAGSIVRQVDVPAIDGVLLRRDSWTALPGGDWLISSAGDERSRVWRVQGATGTAQELAPIEALEVEGVVAAADGGFAAHSRFGDNSIVRCSADGSLRWRLDETNDYEDRSGLNSVDGIAIDRDGSLLVLDGVRNLVQRFDSEGKFAAAIELEKALDNDALYVTSLISSPDGSIWIHEGGDRHVWHHLARDGKRIASFSPHRESQETDVGYSLLLDPRGQFWSSDGHQLFSIDEQGVARTRFGSAPDPNRLAAPAGAFFDECGRIAIFDSDSRAVHVFTPDGRRALVCIPDPDADTGWLRSVVTAPDGTVHVQWDDDVYEAYTPDGQRLGRGDLGGEHVAFDRRSKCRWTFGKNKDDVVRVRRFGEDGKVAFETDRRPDGNFFVHANDLACGPDGSVIAQDDGGVLCLFGSKGEPLRQLLALGEDLDTVNNLQLGRRWILVGQWETAILVSLADGKSWSFTAADPMNRNGVCVIGLSPDETQLWALESDPAVLHRFTLPK